MGDMGVMIRRTGWAFLAIAASTVTGWAEAPEELVSRVDRLIRERQPTAEEKRFDEIGWTREIREALRLAKANHRATFLFTHDGHMAIGRC
jgi:hypothetical protein